MDDFSIAARGESLTDQVYRQLTAGILEGRYSPGQRVNMRALAEATGVSQTPVREALSRLISEGVLRVVNRSIEVPLIERQNFDEIFRLRLMLEGQLAEAAAPRLTEEAISGIEDIQTQFEAAMASSDFKTGLRLNVKFHFAIYSAAQETITLQLVERLWLLVGPTMNLLYPALALANPGTGRHRGILTAARSGDPARLRRAVEEDLITAREKMLAVLEEQSAIDAVAARVAEDPLTVRRRAGRPRKIPLGTNVKLVLTNI